ncbi:NADPH-dependent FMN reductase [Halolamina sp.]|jgi:FMN reductase|uniref:NADPH-dependent FMN reductase n=1 Tax=Halolamina sp. TaxID=1940283 RepID=UPI000223BFF0|nr:NADPH-dependent FMN reductase [halophilic archaeon DL31]
MRLLGISGSQSSGSRTRTAVETALDATGEGVETDLLHLGEYDIVTADGRHIDEYEGDTAAALEKIVAADAYVVGTPVYRASYSGVLKNLLDMVPRGQWQGDMAPFENAAVGLVATGATQSHYLAIDEELRPVFAFFGAHTVGSGVYADGNAFADGEIVDGEARERLETLGSATVELAEAVDSGAALSSLEPQV